VNCRAYNIAWALTACVVLAITVAGQQVSMSPIAVRSSFLIEKIREIKALNPKFTPGQLSDTANQVLEKSGVSFGFYFDAATCEKIRKVKREQKDPNTPLTLGAKLKSVDADGASLSLPAPILTTAQCGDCYVEMPVLEITANDFVTVVGGHNIKFHLPSNFFVNEARLLDPADSSKVKRSWRIPFRGIPLGVTFDENVLYLGFNEPDLDQLSLAVFGEGVFQIATREEAEAGGKGAISEANPADPSVNVVRFDRWKNKYLVAYKPPCLP